MVRTKQKLLDVSDLQQAAECLRTLAHPHRLRMIQVLLQKESTVGELARACEIQSHVASEHLRKMKDRALLASRRDGRNTYYRVVEEGLTGIMQCVESRFGSKQRR